MDKKRNKLFTISLIQINPKGIHKLRLQILSKIYIETKCYHNKPLIMWWKILREKKSKDF